MWLTYNNIQSHAEASAPQERKKESPQKGARANDDESYTLGGRREEDGAKVGKISAEKGDKITPYKSSTLKHGNLKLVYYSELA